MQKSVSLVSLRISQDGARTGSGCTKHVDTSNDSISAAEEDVGNFEVPGSAIKTFPDHVCDSAGGLITSGSMFLSVNESLIHVYITRQ